MNVSRRFLNKKLVNQQKTLAAYQWRTRVRAGLLLALLVVLWIYDRQLEDENWWPYFQICFFASGILSFWDNYRLTKLSRHFRLTFPEVAPEDVLFTWTDPNDTRRIIITREEVRLQVLRGTSFWPANYFLEHRVHKADIISIKQRWSLASPIYDLTYRIAGGTNRWALSSYRQEGLEEALYANVNLAEAQT